MVRACAHGGRVSGCAEPGRPVRQAACRAAVRLTSGSYDGRKDGEAGLPDGFGDTVRAQLGKLCGMGLPKPQQPPGVAAAMHLMPHHDRACGGWLVRPRARDGTYVSGRYATLQCIAAGGRLVLGILRMPAPEDQTGFVRKIVCSAPGAGASVGTAMPGRGSFAAGVMAGLGSMGVGFPIHCKNTDTAAAAAIAEYAGGGAAACQDPP